MVLDVPVLADEKLLEISAREYGVLWTPMSVLLPRRRRHPRHPAVVQLRSTPDLIDEGVRRLAGVLNVHLASGSGEP